jgi:hypothetical protein
MSFTQRSLHVVETTFQHPALSLPSLVSDSEVRQYFLRQGNETYKSYVTHNYMMFMPSFVETNKLFQNLITASPNGTHTHTHTHCVQPSCACG